MVSLTPDPLLFLHHFLGLYCVFLYPQILIEASLVFFLGINLIRTRQQGLTLVLVLAAAITLRNTFDLAESWVAIVDGAEYSKIRIEKNYFEGISTGQSAWRSLLLPIFLSMAVYARTRGERVIFGLAVISGAAWLGISGTLTALASIVVLGALLAWQIPRDRRRSLRLWLAAVALVWLSAALTFPVMLRATFQDLQTAFTGNEARVVPWKHALSGFVHNPLYGTRSSAHHSYLLGRAQEMGLVFLVPFGLDLWMIWRHAALSKRRTLAPSMLALVIGIQCALLLSMFHNFIGTAWHLGEYAFLFWLLVGVNEGLYLHAGESPQVAGYPAPQAVRALDTMYTRLRRIYRL